MRGAIARPWGGLVSNVDIFCIDGIDSFTFSPGLVVIFVLVFVLIFTDCVQGGACRTDRGKK